MALLQALIGETTYDLNAGTPFIWIGEDGVGMAPIRRITEQGPFQYGDTDLDFRLDPRTFRESFQLNPSSLSDQYTQRETALRVFRPTSVPIKLRWTLDNGKIRQIDCHCTGGITNGSNEREGFTQKFVVEFRAADPTFYDPTLNSVPFALGGGSGGFNVPVTVPLSVGASTLNVTTVIAYNGNWRTYPIIVMNGPIVNPVILNTTTGEKLDFTGVTLTVGTTYTIDLRYGYKTIIDQTGANKIASLSTSSDLATFHLDAAPEAAGGLNGIQVTGTGVTTASAIYLQYYERFLGI